MRLPFPDIVRRIEDEAAALMAAGNLTNDQVRAHLGDGSLSRISPVMRVLCTRSGDSGAGATADRSAGAVVAGSGVTGWEDTLAAREQADAGIARADDERDRML